MNPETKDRKITSTNYYKTVLFVLILVALFGYYNAFQKSKRLGVIENQLNAEIQKNKNATDCTQCGQNKPTSDLNLQNGKFKTFTSDKMGVSFSYYEDEYQKLKIVEDQNKIYLGLSSLPDVTKGLFIEVFQKDPNQNLSEIIKQKFVDKAKWNKCNIGNAELELKGRVLNPTYEYLNIESSSKQNQGRGPESIACSDLKYMMGYFFMDKGHPNKYVYVYLGQSSFNFPIDSDNKVQWDYSISLY